MNYTIQEQMNCMLSQAGLFGAFSVEVMKIVVHVINISPNKNLDSGILEEAWSGKKPSYNHLCIFACEAYAHVPKELWKKRDPKSKKCIFGDMVKVERWAIISKI